MIERQTFISDLLTALWIVIVLTTLFLWLPAKSGAATDKESWDSRLVGIWSRTMLVTIASVLILSAMQLLNWLTWTLLYLGFLVFNYLETRSQLKNSYWQLGREWLLSLIDVLDSGISLKACWQKLAEACKSLGESFADYLNVLSRRYGMVFVFLLTVVVGYAVLLRWQYPLMELRFSHPDNYGTLLITRRILAGNYPEIHEISVYSAWAVIISLLGSLEPMQILRFLAPILGILMVLSVGYCCRVLTKNIWAALVGMSVLGVYFLNWQPIVSDIPESLAAQWITAIAKNLNAVQVRQWAGNELELGAIFVLLSLGYYADASRKQKRQVSFWLNFGCSLIMIALAAPKLLILVAIAAIALTGGKRLALALISIAWVGLGILAAIPQTLLQQWTQQTFLNSEIVLNWGKSFSLTLPIGLSLLAALLFLAIAELTRLFFKQWSEPFCLALVMALAINFLLPSFPNFTYLEYEIAARKSLEIANVFPHQSWSLAAPVEQLAEIYGSGWYEDLASLVEKYSASAGRAEFSFPVGGEHLFVFVEKTPFVTFPDEPAVVSYDILSDRTYRYYRSSAGRASLQFEALQMCEVYRRTHPHSEIYYEDEKLRIYHFAV